MPYMPVKPWLGLECGYGEQGGLGANAVGNVADFAVKARASWMSERRLLSSSERLSCLRSVCPNFWRPSSQDSATQSFRKE